MTMHEQPGHLLVPSEELKGQALAWACCAVYQVPAAILEGVVHVEPEPGKWHPFDAEAMLRSLVLGHVPSVLVPNELTDPIPTRDSKSTALHSRRHLILAVQPSG